LSLDPFKKFHLPAHIHIKAPAQLPDNAADILVAVAHCLQQTGIITDRSP
jgi:hypothetical protein